MTNITVPAVPCDSCGFTHHDVRTYAYVIPAEVPADYPRTGSINLGTACGCRRSAERQGVVLS